MEATPGAPCEARAAAEGRRVVRFDARATVPRRGCLLGRAGLPPDRDVPARLAPLVEEAIERYAALAAPVAVVVPLERAELEALLSEPREPGAVRPESAVSRVAARASRGALFAATVGPALSSEVRALFASGDGPRAFFLDVVASEGAGLLAGLLASSMGDATGESVLAYSPGYCGWPLEGQRALFARLAPAEAGITLGEGTLMEPVKSVSGVLLGGPAGIHRFRQDLPCCGACAERTCLERMASLREGVG